MLSTPDRTDLFFVGITRGGNAMMKWMTIGAGSIIGAMLGWNFGHRFFDPSTATFLGFVMSMVGTYAGWKMSQEV